MAEIIITSDQFQTIEPFTQNTKKIKIVEGNGGNIDVFFDDDKNELTISEEGEVL